MRCILSHLQHMIFFNVGQAPKKKEKKALQAIVTCMIRLFDDNPASSYMTEAAMLSSIAHGDEYDVLLRNFANKIINGTTDKNVVDPNMLRFFTYTIRQASETSIDGLLAVLTPVLRSLTMRLDDAKNYSQPEIQYPLLYTLSIILDAMGDVGIGDLSRENLHEPLLQSLKGLQDHKELRVAQSASYAYQASLGISNVVDALRLHQNLPEDVINSFLHQLEEKQRSSQVKANIYSALWKHSTPSLFSSPKVLTTYYRELLGKSVDDQLVLYIHNGSVYIHSSQERKKISPAMNVTDVKSLLLDEASRIGNPVAQFYK